MQQYPQRTGSQRHFEVERVAAYLDGFNIYNGMMAKGWGAYRWLDYPKLLGRFMRGTQHLVLVKYFTSLLMHQPDRYARQSVYLQALEARGGVEIIRGQFTTIPMRCKKCQRSFKIPREKQTDVNLATHLLTDAYDDRFDTFIVCTADTDLVPAIACAQARFGKRFILLDPPRRHADDLAAIADQHLHFPRTWFVQSQLPDPVEIVNKRGRIRRLYRPPSWHTPSVAGSVSEPDDDGVVYCLCCGQPAPHAA